MLDVNAISSIFSCQNEIILLYSQVFKDVFRKIKHCFVKFKGFSRRKSFSRSFQGVFKDLSVFSGVFQARANHEQRKVSLLSTVVGILKTIQEEPIGKFFFSIKLSDNILSIH